VPYTRGEEVSRPLDDVLAEIASLAERGVREVTLLGQNVNGYRGDTHDGNVCDFASLLYIIAEIPGIGRIRYTTSHPLEFSDALINAYKDIPALVSHLHLPVQSGSNAVLAGMKRNHTIDIYIDKINKLRAIRPDIHLASDFIIGFPGEGDAEFTETMDFIKAMDFDHSYSFIYSKRPGTPAAQLPDVTSAETKKERLAILKDVIKRNAISKTDAMLGSTIEVLVEKTDKNDPTCVIGSAANTRLVQMHGGSNLIGKFVIAKVTRIASMNLVEADIIEVKDGH
jgi:tRNA-2-methylthio-N6-dimethylallyladenosine synthase